MQILRIQGGRPLEGTVPISGAKNGALPILAASVMCSGVCRVENCPNLTDVDVALEILAHLGAECTRRGSLVTVDPAGINRWDIPSGLMRRMRGSIFFLGPLMARFGRCGLASPGGCPLGERPVDYHIRGLQAMGAQFSSAEEGICCCGILKGARITLPFPSVGTTENLLMAALGARGETVICNAAREPEIVCLCDFLRAGGCRISGDGSGEIHVFPGLPGEASVTLIPDRMEAATYLCAAAATGGRVQLQNCCPEHLEAVLKVLKQAGCVFAQSGNRLSVYADGLVSPGRIETGPYPAFPTDAQAPMMAVLAGAKGESTIRERVFSQRMHHIPALQSMGAKISLREDAAVIAGTGTLYGGKVTATDLRGGAALVVAALGASGETKITGLGHLFRGYEDIAGKLGALGARISLG